MQTFHNALTRYSLLLNITLDIVNEEIMSVKNLIRNDIGRKKALQYCKAYMLVITIY
jgi:hypothetical protein